MRVKYINTNKKGRNWEYADIATVTPSSVDYACTA